MQLLGTPSAKDNGASLERLYHCLPPLTDIFARWRDGVSSPSDALALRAQALGAASLSSASLRLLYDLASPYVEDPPERICWHTRTHSASITGACAENGLSGNGREVVAMDEHRRAGAHPGTEALGLPRRAAKQCSTNPVTCCPRRNL